MFISLSTVPLCVFWLNDPRFGRCNPTLPDIFPLLQQTRQTTHCIGPISGAAPCSPVWRCMSNCSPLTLELIHFYIDTLGKLCPPLRVCRKYFFTIFMDPWNRAVCLSSCLPLICNDYELKRSKGHILTLVLFVCTEF